MARQKKIKTVQIEENREVKMDEQTQVLDTIETEIDLKRQELERLKIELQETQNELKKIPNREYSQQENDISERQIATSCEKETLREKIERQKAYDNQLVTGKFMNLRVPGKTEKMTYIKNTGDPVKWYIFEHGKTYTIPRGFADQINDYYHTPRFIQRQGAMNPDHPESQIAEVDTSNKKFAFVTVGFG